MVRFLHARLVATSLHWWFTSSAVRSEASSISEIIVVRMLGVARARLSALLAQGTKGFASEYVEGESGPGDATEKSTEFLELVTQHSSSHRATGCRRVDVEGSPKDVISSDV